MNLKALFLQRLYRNSQQDKLNNLDREIKFLTDVLYQKAKILQKESQDVDDLQRQKLPAIVAKLKGDYKNILASEKREALEALQEYETAKAQLDAKQKLRIEVEQEYQAIPDYTQEFQRALDEKISELTNDRKFQFKLRASELKIKRNQNVKDLLDKINLLFSLFERHFEQLILTCQYLDKPMLHLEFYGKGRNSTFMKNKFTREFEKHSNSAIETWLEAEPVLEKRGIVSPMDQHLKKLKTVIYSFIDAVESQNVFSEYQLVKKTKALLALETEMVKVRTNFDKQYLTARALEHHLKNEHEYMIVEYQPKTS